MIAIYLRVSTLKQETKAQKHSIDNWCKKRGYKTSEIIEYIDDGISKQDSSLL